MFHWIINGYKVGKYRNSAEFITDCSCLQWLKKQNYKIYFYNWNKHNSKQEINLLDNTR